MLEIHSEVYLRKVLSADKIRRENRIVAETERDDDSKY